MTANRLGEVLHLCIHRPLWQRFGSQMPTFLLGKLHTGLSYTLSRRMVPGTGSPVSPMRYFCHATLPGQSLEANSSSSPPKTEQEGSLTDGDVREVPFLGLLRECTSPADVLDVGTRYTGVSLSHSLMRILELTKKTPSAKRHRELQLTLEHPAFKELCQRTMQGVTQLRSVDLAYSLLAVVELGVAQRSWLVNTLLRAAQESLNDFDERSLSVLAIGLDKMEESKNVEALKDGLRLIVQVRLKSFENIMYLMTLVRYLGRDFSEEQKSQLEKKALSMADQLTPLNAQYMMLSLASIGFRSKSLLDVCGKNIAASAQGMPFPALNSVLQSCKELKYRNQGLFSAISREVASAAHLWPVRQVVSFFLNFDHLGFCPHALMEVFREKVIVEPDSIKLKSVIFILKAFSSLNYNLQDHRQQFLDSVTHLLESHLPTIPPSDLLMALFYLSRLGHFPVAPLERLLQRETLEVLLPKDGAPQRLTMRMLQTLELCLRLDRPPLPRPIAFPPGFAAAPVLRDMSPNAGLVTALQSIMGDEAVQAGVLEENIYFIDCVVTVPVTEEPSGESSPVERSQRLAVFCVLPSVFCFGTAHPRGPLAQKIRHLKALGYTPFLVWERVFDSMAEEKRVDFLRTRLFGESHGSALEQRPEIDTE